MADPNKNTCSTMKNHREKERVGENNIRMSSCPFKTFNYLFTHEGNMHKIQELIF